MTLECVWTGCGGFIGVMTSFVLGTPHAAPLTWYGPMDTCSQPERRFPRASRKTSLLLVSVQALIRKRPHLTDITLATAVESASSRFRKGIQLRSSWLSTQHCSERVNVGRSWSNNRNGRSNVLSKSGQLSLLGSECLALLPPRQSARYFACTPRTWPHQSARHFDTTKSLYSVWHLEFRVPGTL